jgi:GTP cyclohydrolase I
MSENKRKKQHNDLECVQIGFANGVAPGFPLTEPEKWKMVDEAEEAYGKFLDALGCDWRNDPNSSETPRRIAKKYVFEQWKGRYDSPPAITSFPSDGYQGLVTECNIPLTSMCSHHHENILGRVHIAYIPGEDARVIGLSKLNRLVEHFGRRGAIQEQLTMAIHQAVDKVCENNIGVAVSIIATHSCVSCRGTGHRGASMVTNHLSGVFKSKPEVRKEYFDSVIMANNLKDSH